MSTNLEAPAQRRPGLVSVDGRTYPLESARLAARAGGGLAFSRLTQTFANPHEQALEVVYTMPLPADGAVLGYTVRIGERVIRGVVEPRETAQAAFERALAELGVPASRALHIGDEDVDRLGAGAAGLAFAPPPLATLPERLGL